MIPSSSPASTVKTLKSNSSSSNLQASSYGSLPADIEEGASDDDDDDADGRVFRKHSVIELAPGPVNDEVAVVANTINSILGVSLFAMPWGFQQSGMLGGIIVLSIVAWLSFETARMLLVSQNTCYRRFGDVLSYPDIAGITLGATWSKVVRIATILSCLGGCTGYLIFFGETVGQALSLASETVILAATVPLILLSWIRSFRELTIFAVFGVVSLVVTVVVVLLDGSRQIRSLDDMPPLFKPRTLPAFMGPATFLFTIHYIILAMGAEALKQRPWMTFHTTAADGRANSSLVYSIGLSYFISLVLVVLVGGSGYMMYRNVMVVTDLSGQPMIGCEGHVCQNVILNLSPGLSRDLVGLAMSVVIILSYILILAPAREHIENEALRSAPCPSMALSLPLH